MPIFIMLLFALCIFIVVIMSLKLILSKLVSSSDFVAKTYAKLTKGQAVILEDCFGDTYRTIAYTNPYGSLHAHVYFGSRVGGAILIPGGAIHKMSESSYITSWSRIK